MVTADVTVAVGQLVTVPDIAAELVHELVAFHVPTMSPPQGWTFPQLPPPLLQLEMKSVIDVETTTAPAPSVFMSAMIVGFGTEFNDSAHHLLSQFVTSKVTEPSGPPSREQV